MNMQLRCLCTSARLHASQSQLGKIVNKVMSLDHPKKSRNKESSHFSPVPVMVPKTFTGTQKVKTHNTRRVAVLNKNFMKYITDLMSTGEVASKLVGRGIEISHVNVAPDFRVINVYWFAQNEDDANESTEKILKAAAGHLQHELSQLRVIGMVPPINFVKNKSYWAIREVEDRLSKVDFGEDFVPTAHIQQSNIPTLKTSLPPDIKAKISELNSEIVEDEENYDLSLPQMRQNVMGFDQSYVMKKVKLSLSKTKAAEMKRILQVPDEPVGNGQVTTEEITSFLSNRQEKQLFDDFLKKRMSDEKRKLRAQPLLEIKLEEEEEWQKRMNDDYSDDDDDHYIDKEYDDYQEPESQLK